VLRSTGGVDYLGSMGSQQGGGHALDARRGASPGSSCGPSGRPRDSRATRRRALVLIAVHLLFALHMVDWATTGRTFGLFEPSESMEFSKHSMVNVGLLFFGGLILSTLLLGRFFCGWACHLVALQDLCRALLLRAGITPRPLRSRALAWVPFLAGGYMFVWPLAYRIAQGDDLRVRGVELTTQDVWATMPGPWVGLATLVVCGFVCVWFLGSKGFCTYACPYGAAFSLADRFAPGRIRVNDACKGCGHCTQVCTSNVDVKREVAAFGMVVDPGCMKCLDCVSVCPEDALRFGFGRPAVLQRLTRARRLGGLEEALLAMTFAATFFAVRGLYDLVPFLFALGIAGCVAFLALRLLQLVRRPSVRLVRGPLKEGGRLTGAGRAFVVVAGTVLLAVGHAGYVQALGWSSARAFEPLTEARTLWFTAERPALTEELQAAAARAEREADRALAAGLLPDPRRLMELAWAALVQGDEAGFEQAMERARLAAPRAGAPAVDLAHSARARGDRDATLRNLRAAVAADPDLHGAWSELVEVLAERGELQRAVDALRSGLEDRPADGRLLDLLGTLQMAQGRALEAEVALERAVREEPQLVPPRIKLAQVLALRGALAEARALLREGIEANPTEPALRDALSQIGAAGAR
jgi:ferredoxin-type protein NapH